MDFVLQKVLGFFDGDCVAEVEASTVLGGVDDAVDVLELLGGVEGGAGEGGVRGRGVRERG